MPMLCWSAWLRVHHIDPQFRPDVINTGKNPDMVWSRWAGWDRYHPDWRSHYIDTTRLTPQQTAEQVVEWIHAEQALYAGGYRLVLN